MKIFVAIPVYDGKLMLEVVRCLLNEKAASLISGDEIDFRFLPSCSHPAMGRNQLVADFLSSDCDRLVFLDADVTFEIGTLLKLARTPVDMVGGAYRYKFSSENYPIGWKAEVKELHANEHGLLEVDSLPGGFLAISRKAFEQFKSFHGNRDFEHFGRSMYCFFQMLFKDGNLHGEDSYFCREYRQSGGKVYLDPEIALTHWDGTTPYRGHIGNWLRSKI